MKKELADYIFWFALASFGTAFNIIINTSISLIGATIGGVCAAYFLVRIVMEFKSSK